MQAETDLQRLPRPPIPMVTCTQRSLSDAFEGCCSTYPLAVSQLHSPAFAVVVLAKLPRSSVCLQWFGVQVCTVKSALPAGAPNDRPPPPSTRVSGCNSVASCGCSGSVLWAVIGGKVRATGFPPAVRIWSRRPINFCRVIAVDRTHLLPLPRFPRTRWIEGSGWQKKHGR